MKSRRLWSLLVLVTLILSAFVPAMLAPGVAEAENSENGWLSYMPNHPEACVQLPYDCYVIYIRPAP